MEASISTKDGQVQGSPHWLAPEVIQLQGHSFKSDIWAIGCIAHEMACGGKPPYADFIAMTAMWKIVVDESGPPLPTGISPLFEAFIKLCWNRAPASRPTARQLIADEWIVSNRVCHFTQFRTLLHQTKLKHFIIVNTETIRHALHLKHLPEKFSR